MSILDYLRRRRTNSAAVAKERLQIILSRERVDSSGPDFLPELKKDLLDVVAKYVKIDMDQVTVNLDKNGDTEILELNVILADQQVSTKGKEAMTS